MQYGWAQMHGSGTSKDHHHMGRQVRLGTADTLPLGMCCLGNPSKQIIWTSQDNGQAQPCAQRGQILSPVSSRLLIGWLHMP